MKYIIFIIIAVVTVLSSVIYLSSIGPYILDWVFDKNSPLTEILTIATTISTVVFVCLLFLQLRGQRAEHNLTIRPIITLDKNYPNDPAIKLKESTWPYIRLRLTNLGSISAGKARIMSLPLDEHSSFVRREKALKKYIKNLKDEDLKSDNSCSVLDSMRDRIKSSTKFGSFNRYLVIGDELKKINSAKSKLDILIDNLGDKKEEFEKAGMDRSLSLSKLNPDEWEMFYQAGIKRGNLLDMTGPIDWENFDSEGSLTREDIKEIAKEDAELIYGAMDKRKKIIEDMSKADRKQFENAKKRRGNIWNPLPFEIAKMWVVADLNLRKAYKEVKDVSVKMLNLVAPHHPIYLSIDLEESDVQKINAGNYMYFGVLVQYGKLGSKKYQYVYYLQGYFHNKMGHVDYSLDFLDT